jgi:hypothetical protein
VRHKQRNREIRETMFQATMRFATFALRVVYLSRPRPSSSARDFEKAGLRAEFRENVMWLRNIAVFSLILFYVLHPHEAFSQSAGATIFPTENDQLKILDIQKRAIGAADSFAAALQPSRNTAEYTVDLKNALKLYYGVISIAPSRGPTLQRVLTKLDQDDRYRQNLKDLVSVTDPSTADSGNRIWRGQPTHGYLSTVAVKLSANLCTGIIIADDAVLTAAHCVCDDSVQEIDIGWFSDADTNTRFQRSSIKSVSPMRKCNAPKSTAADVALIRLSKKIDPSIKPAVFATADTINSTSFVRAVGFGSTRSGSAGQKLYVDIPMATVNCNGTVKPANSSTQQSDGQWYGCFPDFELVAGQPLLDKDTCHGDSGGPIFFHADNGNGGYEEFLVAITSRNVGSAHSHARDCGDGGIYERVDGPVRDWLTRVQKVNIASE